MKANKMQIIKSLILGMLLSVSLWQNAKAFTPYGSKWSSSTQGYGYASSLPVSFWTYIDKGANVWTNVTPSHWVWTINSPTSVWIYYSYIDGPGNIAANAAPYGPITFDNSENWYAGSGVPAYNQLDVQSIAAHELGHALRLNHTSGIYCPGNTNNATMCQGGPWGSYYMRTLEGDDRNGVNYLYP
jgi:hypothetical protein